MGNFCVILVSMREPQRMLIELCCLQSTLHGAADRALEAGRAMTGLLQSLASSIKHGTPTLFPKGASVRWPISTVVVTGRYRFAVTFYRSCGCELPRNSPAFSFLQGTFLPCRLHSKQQHGLRAHIMPRCLWCLGAAS